MIVLTRGLARRFRAVARKCQPGRPRGPAPPVVGRSAGGTLTLTARLGGVAVAVAAPAPPGGNEVLVVPKAVLEAVDGAGADSVELRLSAGLRGEARWADRGVPRSLAFDAVEAGPRHDPPPQPAEWIPVPPRFLTALDECGRTAARDPARFAFDRVQVRGKTGQVIGTDGKVALIAGGFALPFADDLLVPAVPVFGCREVVVERDIRVGRAGDDLVVRAGPWTVWLGTDPAGRFPDVAAVVPRSHDPAVVVVDGADARTLLAALPGMPGADGDGRPVTLDLDGSAAVVRAQGTGGAAEVRLARSAVTGPPARVALDRAVVGRALRLGCHAVRLCGAGKPAVFDGAGFTFVAVPLDPSCAVLPAPDDRAVPAAPPTDTTDPLTPTRRTPMTPPETNGHAGNGRPAPPPADAPDLLAEAEALRGALADAVLKAGRLVAALKHHRKQKKALETAWTSLKSLHPGP